MRKKLASSPCRWIGWKKNLKKHLDLTTRVNLVQNLLKTKELPVKTGAALLDINRTSVYYKGTPISQDELDCKSIIDLYTRITRPGEHDNCLPNWRNVGIRLAAWKRAVIWMKWGAIQSIQKWTFLNVCNRLKSARIGSIPRLGKYVHTSNYERCHSALNNQTPASCYYPILLLDDHAA